MYVATAVVLCGTISCSSKKESKSTQSYTTSTEILQGSWNIISVDGKKIVSEEPTFLAFDLKEKRIHGNNGCNTDNNTEHRQHRTQFMRPYTLKCQSYIF